VTLRTSVAFSIVLVLSVYTFLVGQMNLSTVNYGELLWLVNFSLYVVEAVLLALLGGAVALSTGPNVGFGVYLLAFYVTDLVWSIFTCTALGSWGDGKALAMVVIGAVLCVIAALAQAGAWTQYSEGGIVFVGVAVGVQVTLVTALLAPVVGKLWASSVTGSAAS
jgi:hypothetical protein